MTRFLSLVLLALAALSATGCNTVAGVGKDIQKAGDTIEDAAKKR
jgi:predicted small secreted protein